MANIENAVAADSTTSSPPPSNSAKSANLNEENLDEKINTQQEEIEKQVTNKGSFICGFEFPLKPLYCKDRNGAASY